MSVIVADSSPLNILVRIGCESVLQRLYSIVLVPPAVLAEMSSPCTPPIVRAFMASPPAWLQVRAPHQILKLSGVHAGETEAISLALEERCSLLIDDSDGRKVAKRLGLGVVGTLGVLERAGSSGLIDFPQAADALSKSDFRLDPALIEAALHRLGHRKP